MLISSRLLMNLKVKIEKSNIDYVDGYHLVLLLDITQKWPFYIQPNTMLNFVITILFSVLCESTIFNFFHHLVKNSFYMSIQIK
jgi:hypothetical protein